MVNLFLRLKTTPKDQIFEDVNETIGNAVEKLKVIILEKNIRCFQKYNFGKKYKAFSKVAKLLEALYRS